MIGNKFLTKINCCIYSICRLIDFFFENVIKALPWFSLYSNLFLKLFHSKCAIIFQVYQMIIWDFMRLTLEFSFLKKDFMRSNNYSVVSLSKNEITRILNKIDMIWRISGHYCKFPSSH